MAEYLALISIISRLVYAAFLFSDSTKIPEVILSRIPALTNLARAISTLDLEDVYKRQVQTVAFDQLQKSNLVDALTLVLEHKSESKGDINSEISKLREQIEDQRIEAEKLEGQGKAERKPADPRSTRP